MKTQFCLILILFFAVACQNKQRLPNQVNTKPLERLVQIDRELTIDPQHASQVLNIDQSERPVLMMIHGLHESPYFMKHWSDFFSKHNYQIVSIRLPGHFEKNPNALNTVTAEKWIQQAEQFFNSVLSNHKSISILGYSTGGTLASYLALRYPDQVDKLFLISPALALSDSVFLSGLMLGKTNLSGQSLCKDPNSMMCRLLKNLDSQADQMLQDGLTLSPQAGRQVQKLIDITFQPYKIKNAYYELIIDSLMNIKIPVFIADTELDNVISTRTNQQWMKRRNDLNNYLLFNKKDNILHTQIARGPENAFSTGEVRFNSKIHLIEKLFLKGIKTN